MNKLSTYLIIIFLITFAYLYNKDMKADICITVENHEDILKISNKTGVPRVVYDNTFDFSQLDVSSRKKAFIDMLLPQILIINEKISKERRKIEALSRKKILNNTEKKYLVKYYERYKCNDLEELLLKYDTIPPDIVIAQAAIETGWGTSRFFREANNIFGVWSYDENEPRIVAKETRNNKKVYLKKYANILMSINDYFALINSNQNYAEFWEMRKNKKENIEESLTKYSELGYDYVVRIQNIIRKNELEKYRMYTLFNG